MRHWTPEAADLAPVSAIVDLIENDPQNALDALFAGHDAAERLDRHFGQGKWFVCWDEDLRGRPVRGTIQLSYGRRESVVIG